jgi:hypothetical protein
MELHDTAEGRLKPPIAIPVVPRRLLLIKSRLTVIVPIFLKCLESNNIHIL